MYCCRMARIEDYIVISSSPRNAEEAYFMSQKLQYPNGYANLYNLEPGEQCWLGNMIVSPEYRGQGGALFLIQSMNYKLMSFI